MIDFYFFSKLIPHAFCHSASRYINANNPTHFSHSILSLPTKINFSFSQFYPCDGDEHLFSSFWVGEKFNPWVRQFCQISERRFWYRCAPLLESRSRWFNGSSSPTSSCLPPETRRGTAPAPAEARMAALTISLKKRKGLMTTTLSSNAPKFKAPSLKVNCSFQFFDNFSFWYFWGGWSCNFSRGPCSTCLFKKN